MSAEDPAGTQTKWLQYQQRQGQLAQMMQERNNLANQQRAEYFAKQDAALLDKVEEWKADPAKAKADLDALKQTVRQQYDFRPDELQTIADHRFVLIARDAISAKAKVAELQGQIAKLQTEHQSALKAAEAKRVQPAASTVLKPGSGNDVGEQSDRTKAIRKQAASVKSLHEKAEILANLL
jgi:hypothetical protein